jgi:hypothetical protein
VSRRHSKRKGNNERKESKLNVNFSLLMEGERRTKAAIKASVLHGKCDDNYAKLVPVKM